MRVIRLPWVMTTRTRTGRVRRASIAARPRAIALRLDSPPGQIEVLERLAERLTPVLQWRCREHPFDKTRINLDRETQPLGERGDRLLRTGVGTRHEQLRPQRFQMVCQAEGLGLPDGSERSRRLLSRGCAVTY
jgi:hypothetical protein